MIFVLTKALLGKNRFLQQIYVTLPTFQTFKIKSMRLKSLEIKGFKSFANETVIHFNEAITGIVGPNGSGKSNVVDAIRWVLGEQKSAELRLDKMNSVIFNGTKKRKAAQMAQVSLTFENTKNILPTDYAVVTISRILYASGDSEYRLNGVTCRLKDITTLFMDTGIGSNSYAIIALGMVDDILNDKQNSRRMMLEQAAGVSKYKARKHETLHKLQATEEDLARVEDLLYEIQNNLKTLEKQAKRTQKFFDIKNDYRQLSIDLAVLRLGNFRTDYKNLEQKITVETDHFQTLVTEGGQLEAKIEQAKKANLDQEQRLSERQRALNSLVGKIRQAENDKKMAAQQKTFIEQNQQKLQEQTRNAKQRIAELSESVGWLRDDISTEKRHEKHLETELENAKNELEAVRQNHGTLKTDVDIFFKQLQNIEKQTFELEKQKAIAQNQIENLHRDIERQRHDTQARRDELAVLTQKIGEQTQKIDTKREALTQLERYENERLGSLEHATTQLDELNKQFSALSRQLDAKKNEYKLTKNMVEKLEGFPESIQFLGKSANWNAPLLGDVVFVQLEYSAAIENYLENYLNFYIVENQVEALRGVRILQQAQRGKANFFLLDAFQNTLIEKQNAYPSVPSHFVAALSVIEADKRLMPLFEFLLQNVFITEKDDFQNIDFQENNFVVLTKSGGLKGAKFMLSGGSVGLFEGNKIGRKKNLEILEREIQSTEGGVESLQQQILSLCEQIKIFKSNEKTNLIRQTKDNLHQLEQEKVFLNTRLENFSTFIQEADEKEQNFKRKIDELQNKICDFNIELSEKQIHLADLKLKMSDADASYRDVATQMTTLSQTFNEKNVAFIRQQNKVSTLQREAGFKEKQLEETKQNLAKSEKAIANYANEIGEVQNDLHRFDRDLREYYENRQIQQGNLNSSEQDFYKKRNEIHELENKVRENNRRRNDAQSLVNQLKDKFNDIKLKITSIGERLQVEFNVSVNDVLKQPQRTDISSEDLDKKVNTLKRQLDTFGEINPMAVEAYNEMKARHDTIATQRNDIVNAKNSLLQTMQEIEQTATAQFMAAFETIRASFREVFKSLFFEEDDADIALIDPTNPLESGINITAKPRGKRPQSIAQLSGGEKTLTATALLFALYLYKPAPFCIFDEVDAPLDDANIEKFNKIIQKFSTNSQFIIVTHNKATMAAVDVIYGVHMPEQGISAVTPVDFRSLER